LCGNTLDHVGVVGAAIFVHVQTPFSTTKAIQRRQVVVDYPWIDELVEGRLTRKRKRVKVCPADLPEREARKIAAEMLRPMNQDL